MSPIYGWQLARWQWLGEIDDEVGRECLAKWPPHTWPSAVPDQPSSSSDCGPSRDREAAGVPADASSSAAGPSVDRQTVEGGRETSRSDASEHTPRHATLFS